MSARASHLLSFVFAAVLVLAIGGVLLWWWHAPKKPSPAPGAVCLPVRTSLAALALVENPTAKTYAAFGPGAGVFTNVFACAGLVPVTNASGSARADIVFVSGEPTDRAVCRAKEWCSTNGILALHCDVRGLTFKAFQRALAALPETWTWRLWFPGRSDCLVAARPSGASVRPRLADMMDLFAREGLFADFARAGIVSVESVFASYAGADRDVMPVFGFATGEVVPECFVTKEVPLLDWIDFAGVDADIRDRTLLEIRSMQVVRRMILEGDILSRDGRTDAAMEKWTTAIKRNADDPLVLERICQLDVNAETFMKVGNFAMAAQCLETMVCLRPKDVQTIRRLARVFTQLGKKDLAAEVNRRADAIAKAQFQKEREIGR